MSIWKRIRIYAVGLVLGLLISSYFFGDRGGCNIFPSNIVKKDIISYRFVSSQLINCKLQCNEYTNDYLKEFINNASVNFGESKKTTDPKEYLLEYKGKSLMFAIPSNREESVYIIDDFEKECTDCSELNPEYNIELKHPFKTEK